MVLGGAYFVGYVGEVQRALHDPPPLKARIAEQITALEDELGFGGEDRPMSEAGGVFLDRESTLTVESVAVINKRLEDSRQALRYGIRVRDRCDRDYHDRLRAAGCGVGNRQELSCHR